MSNFPTQYNYIPNQKLLDVFLAGPKRLELAMEGLPADDWSAHPRPGKWSIQEIVLHLADAEIMGGARFRTALAEPGGRFVVYDQDTWASELGYVHASKRDVCDARLLFAALRRSTGALLLALPPDAWHRSGTHPEWGTLTVRQLLMLFSDHSERHIEQILRLRSLLGNPTNLSPILELRLY